MFIEGIALGFSEDLLLVRYRDCCNQGGLRLLPTALGPRDLVERLKGLLIRKENSTKGHVRVREDGLISAWRGGPR